MYVRTYVYWCVQVKFQRKQLLLLHSSDTVTDLEDYSDTVSWLCEHASLVLTTGIRAYVHTYVHVKGPVLMLLVINIRMYSAVLLLSYFPFRLPLSAGGPEVRPVNLCTDTHATCARHTYVQYVYVVA